jgi:hypothetical protein
MPKEITLFGIRNKTVVENNDKVQISTVDNDNFQEMRKVMNLLDEFEIEYKFDYKEKKIFIAGLVMPEGKDNTYILNNNGYVNVRKYGNLVIIKAKRLLNNGEKEKEIILPHNVTVSGSCSYLVLEFNPSGQR